MEPTVFESCRRRRMLRWFGLSFFALTILFAAVCTPLFHMINNDIMMEETVFPLLLDTAMILLHYALYWLSFAFVLYGFYRFERRGGIAFLVLYAVLTAVRYFANLLAGYFVMGFPLLRYFLSSDLPYVLIDIVLDLVLMAIFVWIFSSSKNRNAVPAKGRQNGAYLSAHLPFEGLFALRNPVLRTLLWGAVIPSAVQFISRVIFDLQQGLPVNLQDFLNMLIAYLSDYLYILIGFVAMVFLFNRFYLSELKAELESRPLLPEESKKMSNYKKLLCDSCGSNDLIRENNVWICQYCGCKYSAEEMKHDG